MVGQYEKLPERILMDLEAIADEPGMEMLKLIFIFLLFTFFIFFEFGKSPGGPRHPHLPIFFSLRQGGGVRNLKNWECAFLLFSFFLSLGNPPGGPDTHIYRFSSL